MRAEDGDNNNNGGSVGLGVEGVMGKGTIVWWGKTVKGGGSSDKTGRLNSTH